DAPGWKFESSLTKTALVVRLMPPQGSSAPGKITFFPERESVIEPAAPQKITRDGNGVRIEMKLADPPPANVKSISGVAVADHAGPGTKARAISFAAAGGAMAPLAATLSPTANAIGSSTLAALLFALLGGVLLNLMPCVFPVLGI